VWHLYMASRRIRRHTLIPGLHGFPNLTIVRQRRLAHRSITPLCVHHLPSLIHKR
jgi:hypothetical protein